MADYSVRSKKVEYALVFLFFVVLTFLYTWPLVLHLGNGIVGNYGDPLLNCWIMNHVSQNFLLHPSSLFRGNILYPCRDVLAYSEHLFTLGMLSAPVYYITRNAVLAYNLILLMGLAISGVGFYVLGKELTRSRLGGLITGIFSSFCPYRVAKLDHIQIAFSAFLPFAILELIRYLRGSSKKRAFLFGLFLLLQSLVSWHYMVFAYLISVSLILWISIFGRKDVATSRIAWASIILLLTAFFVLPFALPYLKANARLPDFVRTLDEASYYSASWTDYFRISADGLLYGRLIHLFPTAGVGSEKVLNPGLVVIFLALAAIFTRRRKGDPFPSPHGPDILTTRDPLPHGVIFFALLAATGFLLSFGPRIGGVPNPLYLTLYYLGPLKFIRTPTRFFVITIFSLAIMAGYGIERLLARFLEGSWKRGMIFSGLAVGILVLETLTFNLTVYPLPVSGDIPEVYRWLSNHEDAVIVELPTAPLGPGAFRYDYEMGYTPADPKQYLSREALRIYFSIYHRQRSCNGYSGYLPYSYKRIMTELQNFPSPRSMDLLKGLGVDFVVWHWEWVDPEVRAEYEEKLLETPSLSLEKDFGDQLVLRVESGSGSGIEHLESSLVAPESIPEKSPFSMSIRVTNAGILPFVCGTNDLQTFRVWFTDWEGTDSLSQEGKCPTPFFLEPGESTLLPLTIEKSPSRGRYTVKVTMEEGVMAGIYLECPLETMPLENLAGSSYLDGELIWNVDAEPLSVQGPDGLYPLTLTVTNKGDTLLRASWKELPAQEKEKLGMVYIGFIWGRGEEMVWEEAGAMLPCDLPPGQTITFPLLIRPPRERGHYTLFAGLRDASLGWFGAYDLLEVEIK